MSAVWFVRKSKKVDGICSVLLVSYLEPSLHFDQNALSVRDLDGKNMLLSNQSTIWTKLL